MTYEGKDLLDLERIVEAAGVPPKCVPMSRDDRMAMVDDRGKFVADKRRAREEQKEALGRSRQKAESPQDGDATGKAKASPPDNTSGTSYYGSNQKQGWVNQNNRGNETGRNDDEKDELPDS